MSGGFIAGNVVIDVSALLLGLLFSDPSSPSCSALASLLPSLLHVLSLLLLRLLLLLPSSSSLFFFLCVFCCSQLLLAWLAFRRVIVSALHVYDGAMHRRLADHITRMYSQNNV